ncbi:hypothetical protein KC19_3G132100 [Ceratodon purpureus]|uniref:RING-type E3 ubiquitin transferase n=1 Tax=Ceratodon purpureus TaxID=3225 RepID=A0A8T0ILP7_CERPU|nr:hypothetical protein KC19_3G132100 [Ceratodon purpureus]
MALEQNREGKRKAVEDEVAPTGKKNAGPKYDLDPDTLECPLCLKVFTPPVYQCENGHTACSGCYQMITKGCPSCSKPIGRIRNIAIEKVIESLQVECKHACHGCNTMLKYTERAKHEDKLCEYRPIPCPVARYSTRHCSYAGPKASIPVHLAVEHNMRTVESSGTKSASPWLPGVSGVLFKINEVWLMVSRLKHFEGDVFRCDSVGASEDVKCRLRADWYLRVYSMEIVARCKTVDASSQDKDFLLIPGGSGGPYRITVTLI